MIFDYSNITLQYIHPTWLPDTIQAAMLRLDKLHPEVSGNKWFKLQCNLKAAQAAGKSHIVTFGGAWSNHLAATAAACQLLGLRCTGIIRGEEPSVMSTTLQKARQQGMQLHFVSREAYRQKPADLFADGYIIPEGGHNSEGAAGCRDILSLVDTSAFTHICCAVGTGTTLAGLINSARREQQLRGYVVLKGAAYLEAEVRSLLSGGLLPSWQLIHEHHGGGYAKLPEGQVEFMNQFYRETGIPLDVVYTGKLVRGFQEDVQKGLYPDGSRVLLIHSGGLQGNLSLAPGILAY